MASLGGFFSCEGAANLTSDSDDSDADADAADAGAGAHLTHAVGTAADGSTRRSHLIGHDDDVEDLPGTTPPDRPTEGSSGLPSFDDALRATSGAVSAGGGRGGRNANSNANYNYYSGTLGAKLGGDGGDAPVVASIAADVQKSREVPPRVAERLLRLGGGGGGSGSMAGQPIHARGARLHLEHHDGLRADDAMPRRVLVVGGAEAVAAALELVDDMVREDATHVRQTIMCPSHCVGALIGPGGTVIASIGRKSGAQVVVEGSRARRDARAGGALFSIEAAPRPVSVSGTPKAVAAAVVMVRRTIGEAQRDSGWVSKRERETSGPGNADIADAQEGARGERARKTQKVGYGDAAEYEATYGAGR